MPKFRKLIDQLARQRPEVSDPERAIASGHVYVRNRPITNPRTLVPVDAPVVVRVPAPLRGELKLNHALREFAVAVKGRVGLDAGAAAGGFTSALLNAGALRVYAVDVGFGQLLGSLRQDDRVVNLEGINIAGLNTVLIPEVVDLIVIDLSYLSLTDAVPQLDCVNVAPTADLIALVKPQFELALASPPSDSEGLAKALARACGSIGAGRWTILNSIHSPIRGRRGSVEFLVHARRSD